MKAPVGLLSDRTVCDSRWRGLAPNKFADVYASALLAGAIKPLNVLSKIENHFAIRTVRFQVQLEADGYFFAQEVFAFASTASRYSAQEYASSAP